MTKTIAAVAAAVVLCLLGGPFATGILAEDRLRERVAMMDANNVWLAAEVASYERSWFSSAATVELTPVIGESAGLAEIPGAGPFVELLTGPVPVRIDLLHGPVSFGESLHVGTAQIVARPDTSDEKIRNMTELLGVPYLFEFRGQAGFGGGFDFDADVPPFIYTAIFGEADFSGLAITGFADRSSLTMAGTTDGLDIQSPFVTVTLNTVAFEMETEFREDGLPVSRSSGSIDSLIAASPLMGPDPLFELENLKTGHSVEVDDSGETVGATMRWSSGLIATSGGQRLENADIGLAANGVDAAAAAAYYQTVGDLVSRSADDPERLITELEPIADAVVRRGFSVAIDPADFSMDLGTFAARADIRIDGSALPPGAPADIRDIAVLLNTLSIDADVTVAKPLAVHLAALAMRPQLQASGLQGGQPYSGDELDAAAEAQAGLMLVALIGQGHVVEEGDSYRSSVSFANGELTINGVTQQGLLPVF